MHQEMLTSKVGHGSLAMILGQIMAEIVVEKGLKVEVFKEETILAKTNHWTE